MIQQSYDPLSISSEEATYTCTTCGFICGMTVAFGLISNEFPDDFSLRSERAVWVILLLLTTCGSCWTIVVVEPVTGLFQDVRRAPRASSASPAACALQAATGCPRNSISGGVPANSISGDAAS